MYKLSVIVPAYNCEKYVSRCIESILSQTGAKIEIIVVNDGSTDNTLDVLKNFGDEIKLITIENSGVSTARNVGLENATGDFVMFVDSDDTLEEGAIQKLIEKQAEYDADIIRFRYKKVYSETNFEVPEYQPNEEKICFKEDFSKEVYPYFMNGIVLNSVVLSIYRHELLENVYFRTDMKVCEDAVFFMDVVSKARNILFLKDVLYNYYTLGESLTGSSIKVIRKYADNYRFAFETIKKLKEWNMFNCFNVIRCLLRPIVLTFDKIGRMRKIRNAEKS